MSDGRLRAAPWLSAAALFVWQLPQNVAGLLVLVFVHAKVRRVTLRRNGRIHYCFARYGGVSLGRFLFVHRDADERLVRHEEGHLRQSQQLGPSYLLVVGLPSLVWAALFPLRRRTCRPGGYFAFWTERWADRLGGVSR